MIKFFILIAIFLRFIFSFSPGFEIDMVAWYSWAERLISLGFGKFYDPKIWTHYTPGYLYILWLLGMFRKLFFFNSSYMVGQLFKFPNNLADILTAVFIYKIIKKRSSFWANLVTVFYLFNPAVIFNSSIWGQADSFLTFLMVFCFWLLLEKRKVFLSAIFFSFAFLVKPQAVFLFPVILILIFKKYNRKDVFIYFSVFLIFSFLLSWPFFPGNPLFGLPILLRQMANDYPVTTLNAFNFWRLFGNWQPDNQKFFNLPLSLWGVIFYFLVEIIILSSLFFKKTPRKETSFYYYYYYYYLSAGLSLFNFFLFLTRVHERYLLPSLAFFLIGGGLVKSTIIIFQYFLLSITHFANLFLVYDYYYPGQLNLPIFSTLNKENIFPIFGSFLSLILFFSFLFSYKKKDMLLKGEKFLKKTFLDFFLWRRKKSSKEKIIKPVKVKRVNLFLFLILLFAFLIRIWRIWHPSDYIFDEVYHGFTAQEMAKGNKMAWEWWNTPPQGFAYEWTHPPLAKLLMAGGVLFFGKNDRVSQFAFRFPAAIFGVGAIWLTFLLASFLFKNERIGLLGAFLFSFDGLGFVMSRVGMADIYFLFFLLLTIYLALKEKYWFSAISLGLALATKWTGMYLWPVVGIILIFNLFLKSVQGEKNFIKLLVGYFLKFVFIPPLIYILVYLPFFTSGHKWSQFIELQKQMWWYHTTLKATHNYQSSALSWPLMIRPVWFWVKYEPEKIGNIYNLGNPFLWWSGVLILPYLILKGLKVFLDNRDLRLILNLIFYFAFWLPWVFSPRIMFLHHYLPALPFLSILIAFFWEEEIKKNFKKSQLLIYKKYLTGYCLLIILTFFFFYPLYTGVVLPKKILPYFFWFSSWR